MAGTDQNRLYFNQNTYPQSNRQSHASQPNGFQNQQARPLQGMGQRQSAQSPPAAQQSGPFTQNRGQGGARQGPQNFAYRPQMPIMPRAMGRAEVIVPQKHHEEENHRHAPPPEKPAHQAPPQKQGFLNSILGDLGLGGVLGKNHLEGLGERLTHLKLDDLIIIGIIFMLLKDDCDDKLLLLALGYLFISGL